jgi:hypothetical protein
MLPSGGTQYAPLLVRGARSVRTTWGVMNCRSTLIRQRRSRSSVTLHSTHAHNHWHAQHVAVCVCVTASRLRGRTVQADLSL